MKAISQIVTKIEGDNITIIGKLVNVTAPLYVAQRTTIHHPVNGVMVKPRRVEVNNHGVMVMRHGAVGVLLPIDEMVAVAIEVDNTLTDAPVFEEHPTVENPTGKIRSELNASGTIQESDDGEKWKDISDAKKLETGKYYRCVVKNPRGETISNVVKV